jgi:PQQ-like domain
MAFLQNTGRLVAAMIAATSVALVPTPASSQSHELRPGVVVDLELGSVYLMSPDGALESTRLDTGETLWRVERGGQPLAVSGQRLLAASTPQGRAPELGIVAYDAATGQIAFTSEIALPSGVQALAANTLSESFLTKAVPSGGNVYISWGYTSFPTRGMLLDQQGGTQPTQRSGTVLYDTETRRSSPVLMDSLPPAVVTTLAPAAQARTNPNERLSIDGRHTLRSERIADNNTWENYEWTIVDNNTGAEVGRLRSHLSQASFMVDDSRIVFDVGPYSRLVDGAMRDRPLSVHVVDLTSGGEVWTRPVRDTAFRGPYPP